MDATASTTNDRNGWIFGTILVILGILNCIHVHVFPGLIYFALALIYLPPASELIEGKIGYAIPRLVKIVLAIAIVWFTLGMSDLFELFEAWMLR